MLRTIASTTCNRLLRTLHGVRNMSSAAPPLTTLSDDEQAMKDAVARFAQETVLPLVGEMDEKGEMDAGVIKGLFDNGLMGIEIDEVYGGTGASFMSTVLVVEELSKVCAAVALPCDIQNSLVNSLMMRLGTTAQKDEWLPRLAQDTIGGFCLSEVSSGSDAFALRTTATEKDGTYELNGSKMWISNAREAGMFLVMANVDLSKRHRGITTFIVPRDTAGLTVGPPERKMGIRASSTCPVHFDGVRVPKENVLGEVGAGYKYAITMLNEGRIAIGAQMLGIATGCLEATLPYLHSRTQFNTPIASFQSVQHQIADMAMDVEAARLLVYNAARLAQSGAPFVQQAAMAKLHASQTAERVSSRCIELAGGVGYTRDMPMEKFYRDAKIGAIYEGTSNIQRQTIAKLVSAQYT